MQDVGEITALSVRNAHAWFSELPGKLTEKQNEIADRILKEIRDRLTFLIDVGLEYLTLARDARIVVAGINQKDQAENARRFLGRNGNPYARIGIDPQGRASIDWGVYGVPETFIVGRDGRIAYKHVGPITQENLASTIRPAIAAALAR